jgi:hypothetical protein
MHCKLSTIPISMLLLLSLAVSNLSAETSDTAASGVTADQLTAELPVEVVRDDAQFKNIDDDSQLRHRVNEQDPEATKKARHEHQPEEASDDEQVNQLMNGDGGAGR